MSLKTQTYNDGVVNIYSVSNIAEPGNKPKDSLIIKHERLHFEERVVGMSRFYSALQESVKIERLIRTPRLADVSTQDIAVLPIGQYKIKQIQYPPDVTSPSMDLSLERLEAVYEFA